MVCDALNVRCAVSERGLTILRQGLFGLRVRHRIAVALRILTATVPSSWPRT
jgi:hypothetical protein